MALSPDSIPKGTPQGVERRLFNKNGLTIEYAVWRPAAEVHQAALAFHGFSRPLEDMLAVRPLLAENTALVMPHLAAHGRSSGHHRPLSPDDWFHALDGILAQEGLAFGGTLIGYSLGGRLALNWWSHQPHRFTRVLLIAPDGLVKNPGYWFSVETLLGRTWLQQSGRQREKMVRFLSWMRRRKWLPEHFYQFSLFHLETAEMWSMVIDCWLSLRAMWPAGNRPLRALSAQHPGVLEAHFGQRDKVVKPKNAKGLKGVCPVHFHPCGHGLLRPDIIERIASPSSKS